MTFEVPSDSEILWFFDGRTIIYSQFYKEEMGGKRKGKEREEEKGERKEKEREWVFIMVPLYVLNFTSIITFILSVYIIQFFPFY